ncbi:MAG: hypothetical protein ACIAQU_05240 [Phycisphaerales bacterium JB064]
MSDDEIMALLVHGALAFVTWGLWIKGVLGPKHLGRAGAGRFVLIQAPVLAMGVLISLLGAFAASDVVGTIYIAFYTIMGAGWIGVFCTLLGFMGVHARDDVGERRNPAAVWLLLGGVVGLSCAFAGSNFGDGPGWWVVAFCSAISMGTVLALWGAVSLFTGDVEAITIDRDAPTGLRCGLLLAAIGLVMGRAAAGDWVDAPSTVIDFVRIGWAAPALALAEVAIGKALRPRPNLPTSPFTMPMPIFFRGFLPGMGYVALAVAYVILVGWW